MDKRKLPIGIQIFGELCEENYYHMNKTAYIHRLIALNRPIHLIGFEFSEYECNISNFGVERV